MHQYTDVEFRERPPLVGGAIDQLDVAVVANDQVVRPRSVFQFDLGEFAGRSIQVCQVAGSLADKPYRCIALGIRIAWP